MSATTQRLPLDEARAIADELVGLLSPACHRIAVAGSIRRSAPTIGDVDILAAPTMVPLLDMFDQPIGAVDALGNLLDELCGQQVIRQWRGEKNRPCWGKDLKRFIFRDLDVQVQAVRDDSSWGFWMIVRTGPRRFSTWMVTPRSAGGALPPGFEVKEGFRLFRYGGLVECADEQSVFTALGLPWMPPEERR
jgi:DNA polymerase/3'-5' exonuclease PolX